MFAFSDVRIEMLNKNQIGSLDVRLQSGRLYTHHVALEQKLGRFPTSVFDYPGFQLGFAQRQEVQHAVPRLPEFQFAQMNVRGGRYVV